MQIKLSLLHIWTHENKKFLIVAKTIPLFKKLKLDYVIDKKLYVRKKNFMYEYRSEIWTKKKLFEKKWSLVFFSQYCMTRFLI